VVPSFRLVFEAVCIADTVHVGNSYFKPNEIVKISSNLTAVAILVFICAITWMLREMVIETEAADAAECSASDYTVICHTIPEYTDTKDLSQKLRDHFETVLLKRGRHSILKMHERGEDVEAQAEADKESHAKFTIADINYSTSAYQYITEAVNRGAAAEKVDRIIRKIIDVTERARREGDPSFDVRKKRTDLVKQLKLTLYEFEFYNDRCQKFREEAEKGIHSAYITFATETGYLRALERYPNVSLITYCIQKERMRMKDKTKEDGTSASKVVFLQQSPDPEEIIWENVPVPWWSVLGRVTLTTIGTILFLGCSYSMIHEARFLKAKVSRYLYTVYNSTIMPISIIVTQLSV
jgi:cbb3-type cytochrome oxidase subunit 3